jgi:hypothetical protein
VQNIAVGNSIMRFATMHTAKSVDNIAGESRVTSNGAELDATSSDMELLKKQNPA